MKTKSQKLLSDSAPAASHFSKGECEGVVVGEVGVGMRVGVFVGLAELVTSPELGQLG